MEAEPDREELELDPSEAAEVGLGADGTEAEVEVVEDDRGRRDTRSKSLSLICKSLRVRIPSPAGTVCR